MRDVFRLKRFGLSLRWAVGLGVAAAAAMLISACVVGPDRANDGAQRPKEILSYFLASSSQGQRSAERVSSTFRTPSGATLGVWREAEPRRTILLDEIRALRIREGHPSPSLTHPTDFVVAEVELTGSEAEFFESLLTEQNEEFLWITGYQGKAIGFLPIVYALRPSREGALSGIWVSAGTFRSREEAEAFFGELGEVPQTFIALSDAERAIGLAENERLLDYAIWESVCDPAALVESGAPLAQLLPALPSYAERSSGVDCRVRPELGRASQPVSAPAVDEGENGIYD